MPRSRSLPEIFQILLIAAGFGAAILAYQTYYPDNYDFLTQNELLLGFLISVSSLWSAVKLLEGGDPVGPWARIMDEFCVGTGINLIADALLNYFDVLTRSLFLIVVGGVFAVALLTIARLLMPRPKGSLQHGLLMLGYDATLHRLGLSLGLPLLGVVGDGDRPAEIPRLGGYDELERVVARLRPSRILLSQSGAVRVSAARLLALRLRGVAVTEISGLYEKLLGRIYCRGFEPSDLVLSQSLTTNSRIQAIQAVYTNLIGMLLLLAASPLILAVSLLVILFCGRGPVLESDEYCGFQNIPFQMMRFRTRRRDGSRGFAGSWLERLRLDRLPQLLHVVRGEMALFGPRPVRRQFARRLTEMLPFYGMRFAVKPGVLGWAQLKLRSEAVRICELTEIEYDLYYIKRGSPLLDLDILVGNVLGAGADPLAKAAGTAR